MLPSSYTMGGDRVQGHTLNYQRQATRHLAKMPALVMVGRGSIETESYVSLARQFWPNEALFGLAPDDADAATYQAERIARYLIN
jgi:hypothetical protein